MSILIAFALALAAPQATPPSPAPAYSSTTTPIGTLVADPAAKAILEKWVPGITSNPQLPAAVDMTLKAVQPYAPDKLSDATLAHIDKDLAALPAAR